MSHRCKKKTPPPENIYKVLGIDCIVLIQNIQFAQSCARKLTIVMAMKTKTKTE